MLQAYLEILRSIKRHGGNDGTRIVDILVNMLSTLSSTQHNVVSLLMNVLFQYW